jgi:hypothetical protein
MEVSFQILKMNGVSSFECLDCFEIRMTSLPTDPRLFPSELLAKPGKPVLRRRIEKKKTVSLDPSALRDVDETEESKEGVVAAADASDEEEEEGNDEETAAAPAEEDEEVRHTPSDITCSSFWLNTKIFLSLSLLFHPYSHMNESSLDPSFSFSFVIQFSFFFLECFECLFRLMNLDPKVVRIKLHANSDPSVPLFETSKYPNFKEHALFPLCDIKMIIVSLSSTRKLTTCNHTSIMEKTTLRVDRMITWKKDQLIRTTTIDTRQFFDKL